MVINLLDFQNRHLNNTHLVCLVLNYMMENDDCIHYNLFLLNTFLIKKNNEDVKEIQEYFYKIGSGIHQKELDEIAQVVRQADQVIFIGLGTSGILGKYGARFFSNLRKFSQYIEDPYFPIMEGIKNAVVIALSVSGETEQIVQMANDFKKNKCKIISITNKGTSTLSNLSDYNLTYYVTDHEHGNHINTTTQIPVIYLIEAIGRRL